MKEIWIMSLQTFDRLRKIMWFSAKRYAADNHGQRAVALTYYTVFAIVPMAALLFGIAKGFDLDVKLRAELSQQLYQHKEILEWVCKFADTTLKQAQGGIVAGVGVVALIWTVLWLASNIERAFNDVWGLPTRKNIFRRFSDYLALILLTPLAVVIVGASGVALRTFLDKMAGTMSHLSVLLSIAADLSPLMIAVGVFTLIYKLAPNTKVRISSALLAGVIAGLLFQLLQDGFIFLQGNIFKYNRIYGTFAVLPLFLVWLQWSWQIVLFGAEIGFVGQNIDSGIFDAGGNYIDSMRMRRANQLACASLIYSCFSRGDGGVTINEIAQKLNIPAAMLDSQLHELSDCRIIFPLAALDSIAYVPGYPCESFTAGECLKLLNGSDKKSAELSEILERADSLLDKFDSSYYHKDFDPLLKDL